MAVCRATLPTSTPVGVLVLTLLIPIHAVHSFRGLSSTSMGRHSGEPGMSGRRPRAGKDWLITSFAVAIVGGTGLAGGRISALGLLLGAVIIVLIKNGLVMLEANVYYEQAFLGSIILLAVVVSRVRDLYGGRSGG